MTLNPDQLKLLIESALNIRDWAYAPYSHYSVGAALLTASGKVYEGVNIENAAYPTTMCAERVAIFKAVSEGEREFTAIAVVTENGGTSCGSCRQVLAEFGLQTQVIFVDSTGRIILDTTVEKLLPSAFTPEDLI
jgi:cytidine deaminase